MNQSTLSVRVDSKEKKEFNQEIYEKLLEAEKEMETSKKRYTTDEIIESMKK